MTQPLADRVRPETLADFVGQKHLVGPGKPLYLAVRNNQVRSMIFWGPPGVGKTTLARIIARQTGRQFFALSAVAAGKNDVREIVEQVSAKAAGQRTLFNAPGAILFLDEIHRFNKAQQDYLLPYVEDGTLVLIGATTENPSFEVNAALLSRAQVYVLESLTRDDIKEIVQRGLAALQAAITPEAEDFLAEFASGDARQALNLLEAAARLYGASASQPITLDNLRDALQNKRPRYDKQGEEHYNTISAFIKSMRASNVDAALYYLARMVDAGEDPLFIARRMVIFASEDIGMAQPTALVVANAVFRACETIGYPECQINLAHGAVYLASAPKDRSAYDAYFAALEDVRRLGNLEIPLSLRNAPTRLMKALGYGRGYEAYTSADLLPEKLRGRRYYRKG
ncbi:MAG: replication-associated recombination protein A [Aggregatilineales bacterium]